MCHLAYRPIERAEMIAMIVRLAEIFIIRSSGIERKNLAVLAELRKVTRASYVHTDSGPPSSAITSTFLRSDEFIRMQVDRAQKWVLRSRDQRIGLTLGR